MKRSKPSFPMVHQNPPVPSGQRHYGMALVSKSELFTALQYLTRDPPAWGDYEWASQMLDGAGMMQFVERCDDDERIAT